MLAEYKKKANIGIALAILTAIVLVFIAVLVSGTSEEADSALKDISVLPMFPFIYGLCCYAKGKGYHGAGLLKKSRLLRRYAPRNNIKCVFRSLRAI